MDQAQMELQNTLMSYVQGGGYGIPFSKEKTVNRGYIAMPADKAKTISGLFEGVR